MWWRWHWKKYGGRRAVKIFLDSAAGIEKWRGVLALWGGAFASLLFFGTPLGDVVMSTWHLLPWWTVPVFLLASLAVLFVRGLIKANYEEFQELEKKRDGLRGETQQPLALPNEELRQQCCSLSAELSELIEEWQEGVDEILDASGMLAQVSYEMEGDPDRSLEIARQGSWLMRQYSEQFGSKTIKLSDELAQHRCINPEIRKRLESPEKPQDVRYIAQRLKLICNTSDFSSQEHRRQRIEEWRSAIRDFDFSAGRFTSTETYSQMRPHLDPDIKRKFEHPGMIILGNATRGEHAHSYMLSDEIARIEKEWGLV